MKMKKETMWFAERVDSLKSAREFMEMNHITEDYLDEIMILWHEEIDSK